MRQSSFNNLAKTKVLEKLKPLLSLSGLLMMLCIREAEAFDLTIRSIDDALSINNRNLLIVFHLEIFEETKGIIHAYPKQLEIIKTIETASSATCFTFTRNLTLIFK
jgi:hypothetical protein